ncbi:MAG: hypothetical protein R3C19_23955 [Planctomycetaceae bacterium]
MAEENVTAVRRTSVSVAFDDFPATMHVVAFMDDSVSSLEFSCTLVTSEALVAASVTKSAAPLRFSHRRRIQSRLNIGLHIFEMHFFIVHAFPRAVSTLPAWLCE